MSELEMLTELVKDIKNDTKLLREVINGNGHPEEGMVYRLRKVEEVQKNCPIVELKKQTRFVIIGLIVTACIALLKFVWR